MILTFDHLQYLAELAISAAKKAGALIQSYAGMNIEVKTKAGGYRSRCEKSKCNS